MKKYLWIAFFVVIYLHLEAGEDFFHSTITQEYLQFDDMDILLLEDQSIFQLFPIQKRWRTLSEWWHGEKITIDPRFFWEKENWPPHSNVQVYKNELYEEIQDKISKKDQKKLSEYLYIVENVDENKIAFAKPLHITALLQRLKTFAEKRYDVGYYKGYSQGYSKGYEQGNSIGHKDGYRQAKEELQPSLSR